MISKELLSEVLDIKLQVTDSDNLLIDNGFCYYKYADSVTMSFKSDGINIYELAHRCKEWAWDNDFILVSKKSFYGEWSCRIHKKLESETFTPKLMDIMLHDTEHEAIFKACEWILNDRR